MSKVAKVIWSDLLPRSAVFSTSEVAERAGVSLPNASGDLRDLERQGIVTRIRRGLWAVSGHPDFSPYAVVPHLFTDGRAGYVSLLSALSLQGMIEQIPRVVHIVTTSQRLVLKTPVATYAFQRPSSWPRRRSSASGRRSPARSCPGASRAPPSPSDPASARTRPATSRR